MALLLLGCSSTPLPERMPSYLRQSIRHLNKGTQYYTKGCYPLALRQFQESHERYVAADHLPGTAASLNSLANTYYRMKDFEGALAVYDEAIALYRQLEDRPGLTLALANKAAALIATGQMESAGLHLDEADRVAGDEALMASQRLRTRAIWLMRRGDPGQAEKLLRQALRLTPDSAQAQIAAVQYALGRLFMDSRRPAQGLSHLEAALEADRKLGAFHGIALDLAALGDSRARLNRHDLAVSYFKRSMKIFALLGDAPMVDEIRTRLVASGRSADVDILASLQWVDRWLAGDRTANICR